MGNEYRDALSAAQRRIDSLEKELALARAGVVPQSSNVWVFAVLGAVALGMVIAVVGAGVVGARRAMVEAPEPVAAPAVVAPITTTHHGVTLYTGSGHRFELVDVDGDGKKEIVSLFWSSVEDSPLHVGVLDRATFAVKWMKGPFPSQWSGVHTHMEIVGSKVVVTDSREKVHVFELATGNEVHVAPFVGGTRALCKLPGSTSSVGLQLEGGGWRILELDTFSMRDAKKGETPICASPLPSCSDKDRATADKPCRVYDAAAAKRAKTPGFHSYLGADTLGATMLLQGQIGPDTKALDALLVLDRKTLAHKWEAPAVIQGDELHLGGHTEHALTTSSVLSFYQTRRGDFRLVSRAVDDGKETWSIVVPQAKEGSYATDFFVEDGEIFLFVDHGLHAVDVESGHHRSAPVWF